MPTANAIRATRMSTPTPVELSSTGITTTSFFSTIMSLSSDSSTGLPTKSALFWFQPVQNTNRLVHPLTRGFSLKPSRATLFDMIFHIK
jgi:hypothetical protein